MRGKQHHHGGNVCGLQGFSTVTGLSCYPVNTPPSLVCWCLASRLPLNLWLVVALHIAMPPPPCVTFHHAAASCVHPQNPLFVPASWLSVSIAVTLLSQQPLPLRCHTMSIAIASPSAFHRRQSPSRPSPSHQLPSYCQLAVTPSPLSRPVLPIAKPSIVEASIAKHSIANQTIANQPIAKPFITIAVVEGELYLFM